MENSIKPSGLASVAKTSSLWDRIVDDLYPRYDKQIWGVLGAVVVAVAVYFLWNYNHQKSEIAENKKLGMVYVLFEKNQIPDAEKALTEFLAQGPSGLARDKGNLFLGKAYYEEQKYDQALEAYGKVQKHGRAAILLYSGALHGRAACYMQKKDYAQAVQILDEFIALCMRRTGDPKEDLAGKEVVDLSPSVPNALWKQALCYRELGQPDKVKAVVERIQKVYPASPEAQEAARLLALVE